MWLELKFDKKGLMWCDGNYLLIVFKFRILGNIRGKGFWKLNVFVLYDVNYVKIMNDFLNNLLDEIENEINLYIKWDLIKI